jgi:transcriptional regulator with PAS, ATPase and Fis domain
MQAKKISASKGKNNKITVPYDLLENIPIDLLLCILDNPYESQIIVDANGIIIFMSSSWEQYYNMKAEEAIGRHISDLNIKTRLPIVLKTGTAEIGKSSIINDKNRIVLRIPIKKDGKTIGAIGKRLFILPENLKKLADRIITLESHIDYYKKELHQVISSRYTFENILGKSKLLNDARSIALKAAKSNQPVLIMGETGVGKELFAHAVHNAGIRANNNFISVNCASIPSELIESELFGYESGSFTGANQKGKIGKFELADNGTIFLDEIGDMPLNMQAKLLRVLQEGEIDSIGSSEPKYSNFRLITATNRNLEEMVQRKEFRQDLFHRICGLVINLPPLRMIKEDIKLHIHSLLSEMQHLSDNQIKVISPDALKILTDYSWPGNVRELRNIIQRAIILCSSDRIELDDLPPAILKTLTPSLSTNECVPMLKDIIQKTEIEIIKKALDRTGQNKRSAAKLLGINRCVLYNKLNKYGIDSRDRQS